MSEFGSKVAEHKNTQNAKREKNRIAQQKHRQKKKDHINKMMTILQKVKLAAAENDIGQVQELVKTPTIILPVQSTLTSGPGQEQDQGSSLEMEELFSIAGASCSPQLHTEVEASQMVDSGMIEQAETPGSLASTTYDMTGLVSQSFFQPSMDPLFWDMGSLLPPSQMPYFDTQSPWHLLPPVVPPNPWQGYPAIMAGM
ncbi:hypothetical protein E5D57_013374 [Metarhizium anisopliae]|nr:hypothetical protein E5D57_013374 [Metarhizium anisopliae]